MSEAKRCLLIVALRCDHPLEVKQRMETILAAAGTYDQPPDTQAGPRHPTERRVA